MDFTLPTSTPVDAGPLDLEHRALSARALCNIIFDALRLWLLLLLPRDELHERKLRRQVQACTLAPPKTCGATCQLLVCVDPISGLLSSRPRAPAGILNPES